MNSFGGSKSLSSAILSDRNDGFWSRKIKFSNVSFTPTTEAILDNIGMVHDIDINRDKDIFMFVYRDDSQIGAYHRRVEFDRDSIEELYLTSGDFDFTTTVGNILYAEKQTFAEQIAKEYEKRNIIMEETKMTNAEYRNFIRTLLHLEGSIEVQGTIFDDAITTITIPTRNLGKLVLPKSDKNAIPEVKKVETYNGRVVKVTFVDDTFTKSVCSENDAFDIDTGITVCLMKRMLGENGTRIYNDSLRKIHKTMEKNEKAKEEAKRLKVEEKEKQHKIELKKAAKKLKAQEEYINLHRQATLHALQDFAILTAREGE